MPSCGDDVEHHAIEMLQGAPAAEIRRRRQQLRKRERKREQRLERGEHRRYRAPHFRALSREIDAEQREPGDLERQLHHRVGDVDSLTGRGGVAPVIDEIDRCLLHHVGEPSDARLVKRRLRDAALSPPYFALAGDEAVAEHGAQQVVAARLLVVVVLVVDQDVLDVVRAEDEHRPLGSQADLHDVTVVAVRRGDEAERIGAEGEQVRDRVARLSGRRLPSIPAGR